MRKDTIGLYSTFFNQKKNVYDMEIINPTYSLSFDKEQSAFTVNSKDSLDKTFTLFENTCTTSGEGEIDLNMNLGKVTVKIYGLIKNEIQAKKTDFQGFVLLDFSFSEQAMIAMAKDIGGDDGIGYDDYDDLFVRNLRRVVTDKNEADKFKLDLEMQKISSFPKELAHTLAFTDIRLSWNNNNRAFVSKGDVGLGNIYSNPINEVLNGLIVFEKEQGTSNDVLLIDLKSAAGEYYFFKYKSGEMWSFSYNEDFKNSIINISASNRRLDGKPKYNYDLRKEDWFKKEQKNFNKKY